MNKAQIKAELRRSACEDEIPTGCGDVAFEVAFNSKMYGEWMLDLPNEGWRIFFLIVAEAL